MRQKGIIFKGLKLLDSIKLWDYSALTSFVIWVNVIDNITVAEDQPTACGPELVSLPIIIGSQGWTENVFTSFHMYYDS